MQAPWQAGTVPLPDQALEETEAAQADPPSLDRRSAWRWVGASAAGLVLLGAALVPWDRGSGGTPSVAAAEVFTGAEIARAEAYAGFVRLLGNGSYLLFLAVATLLGLTPLGARLVRALERRLAGRWKRLWVVPVSVLVLLLPGELLALPFAVAIRTRRLEEGLTTQGVGGWLSDRALSLVVAWVVATIVVALVLFAARRWPRRWFVPAGLAAAALVVLGSLLHPVVVEPLFVKVAPLPAGELRDSVSELADRVGVDVDGVLVADASRRTTTLNAYVSGLGGTRRVVLYDTLVDDAPLAQARVVVAHELAHARHRDVLRGTGLGALGALVAVGLLAIVLDSRRVRRAAGVSGPADGAAAALLIALLAWGGLLASPVENAVSRAIERRADQTALAATAEPEAFVRMQRTLALRALTDPTPPRLTQWWFGSHPTVLERIGLAGLDEMPPRTGADGAR